MAKHTTSSRKNLKLYVLDTNVLFHDSDAIYAFDGNDLIIPMVVLEELDKHKSRQDEVGANARKVSRVLDSLTKPDAKGKSASLLTGVKLPAGGVLKVAQLPQGAVDLLPTELSVDKNDHLIIALMLSLAAAGRDATLVSKDINIRVKCDSLGVQCEDYLKSRLTNSFEEMYTGVATVHVSDELIASLYGVDKNMDAARFGSFLPNQIVVIKPESGVGNTVIMKAVRPEGSEQVSLRSLETPKDAFGLVPRNKEQGFSMDLLYDDDIKLVTLSGPAGVGKTLIALASALDQIKGLGSRQTYDKLIVMRPIQSVGKEMGFLPGTKEEKMEPWLAPVRDNLQFLLGAKKSKRARPDAPAGANISDNDYLALLQKNGVIEVEAIAFMRGRSIPNAFIIIDESQNLSIHELKTLITRAGEGTKIVLTGDVQQIDNSHLDMYTNGLSYATEKFKNQGIAGHISLIKGERSRLATLGSEIL